MVAACAEAGCKRVQVVLVEFLVWAQVAERLMAADCKSATHSSYGGSNPPLCTINEQGTRDRGNKRR